MDTDKPICLIRDVVHAYIYFLDPNRRLAQGTLMLVCNHRVRCISFETFEELNKWVNVLEKNLTCNYFHADLVVASRESCLYGQARRHGRQLHRLLAQKRSVQTATLSTNRFRNGLMPTHGDGYLHVTRDRICFTTGPGCTRPRLLATWSFDNDEIVQCGTARLKSSSDSLDNEQASLFFLTAFPNHPEAPGSHLFISNQATELCDWIEKNNQTAICQAEWRRLTSLAAVLDASALSSHDKSGYHTADDGSVVTARPRLFDLEDSSLTSSLGIIHTVDLSHVCNTNVPLNCSQLTGCAPQNSSEVSRMRIKGRTESACFSGAAGNQSSVPRPDASDDQTSLECVQDQRHAQLTVSPGSSPANEAGCTSYTLESTQTEGYTLPNPKEHVLASVHTTDDTGHLLPDSLTREASSVSAGNAFICSKCLAETQFQTRKFSAMYSRRRFSSHPADCNRREVDPSLSADDCPHLLFSSPSDSSRLSTPSCPEPSEMLGGCCGIQGRRAVCIPPTSGSSLILQQSRWRQSAPQLVTLSPMPMSLKELHEFLQRRSSYRVTSVDRSSTKAEEESHACDVRIDGADVTVASCHMDGEAVERDFEGVPDEGSGKRPELCVISEVQTPGHRVRNKFSESSNTDSGCSEQPLSSRSCSRCGLSLDSTDGLPPVGAVGGRILRQPSCPTSSRLLPIGSAPQAGDPSGYLRRRRRLPSSWSTTVSSSTVNPPESDENPPQSAQNCTEQPVSAQGRQPQFARSLSSGNSPPCSLTPLLPTSSVVPGSQYFTRRRHHTASACEASTFQNKYSSFDQACSSSLPNGAEVDAIRSISAKSSLVSLSSNSIPHWADAPTQAKPRTGFNYVSREFVTALHAQRKLTHQQQVLPPPSSGGRHTDGFGQATSSQTSAPPPSLPYVQPHPCTPVPEAARESEESGSSGHFFSSDATMTSRITTDPDHPTGVRDGLEIRVDPAVVRSYVNVGPTARRLGLQPINEHEAVDPLRSVSTQPLTRRELITESPASAQSGNRTSLISGLFTPTDTTNVSATTLDSYVNLAEYPGTLGGGSLPGIVLHNSSKGAVSTAQQYINLIPLALTSVRGFRGLSPPSVGSLSVHAPLASSDGGSSNFESNMSTVSAGTTTLNPPLLASGPCHPQIPLANDGTSHILPKQIPPSESLNAVTPGTEGHLNGVPRLHYAHLTLSNEKAWRTPSGMSTQAASEVDTTLVQSTSSVTVGSLLYTNRNRQTVQNKLQGPNSDDLGSSTVVPANTAYNSTVATSIVGQSSSSGVNYVTIDMVQTKALSELEQELRLVSAEGSMKSLSQQQSMGSNLRSASSNRNTMAEKGRGFDQDTKSGPWRGGNFDNRRNTSFASRLFTRLAHSFSFRHSHSNRSSKKDKQLDETTSCGSRLKRSYTTTGADHATASSVTASTTANSSPVR